MGNITDYPEYDDDKQSTDVNNFAGETLSNYLFNYYYNAETETLASYMDSYSSSTIDEIVAIYKFNDET